MRQNDNMTADKVLADVGLVWANGMAATRDRYANTYAKCQQCIRDQADGRISGDQEREWLMNKGEPALAQAKQDLERARSSVNDTKVRPIVDPWLREKTERQIALLAEVVAINGEKARVFAALAKMGIPPRPSCEIPEVSDALIDQVRRRLAGALAPLQPANRAWRREVKPLDPTYEPIPSGIAAQ